jgi:tetratricopeptide (TPR) repeat protein
MSDDNNNQQEEVISKQASTESNNNKSTLENQFAQHLEKALHHKQAGNDYVAKQDWKKASFEYKHIPLYLNQYVKNSSNGNNNGGGNEADAMLALTGRKNTTKDVARTPEQNELLLSTLYAAHCNLSLVHLNLARNQQALQSAQAAIDLNPAAAKGYYRRARARLAIGLVEEAEQDFNFVLIQNPGDSASKQGLEEVKKALAKAKEKEARMCAKMFA